MSDPVIVEDLPPPQNIAAEQALLGAVTVSPVALGEVVLLVDVGDFYRPAHRTIYAAVLALASRGEPVDPITLAGELTRTGDLLRVGGAPYLHTLMSAVPTAANAGYYAEQVTDAAVRRRLLEVGQRTAQLAHTVGDTADLIGRARAAFETVTETPGRAAQGVRQLRVVRASEVIPRRLLWLWERRIVLAGLTLLAGREGLGKSTVAVSITAQITRGTLPGEYYGRPANVIYVHTEDARDYTVVPRLIAAGADLDRVIFLDAITADDIETNLVLPHDTELLAATIVEHQAAAVVLDAATSVIDSKLDGDKDRQMRQGLERIAKVAEETSAAVLGIVHFGKRESADTGKLILGSIAWSQVARSVLAVARDDDSGHLVVTGTKTNLGQPAPSLACHLVSTDVTTTEGTTNVGRIDWLGETDHDARDLISETSNSEDRTSRKFAVDWLRDYLTEVDKAPSADVKKAARGADIAERTLARARTQLNVEILSEGFPRTSYWRLPDSPASDATTEVRARESGTTGTTGADQQQQDTPAGTTVQSRQAHAHDTTVGATGTTTSTWRVSGEPA
jgi:hypothetical protein